MLVSSYSLEALRLHVTASPRFITTPGYTEREKWQKILPAYRERIMKDAEKGLRYKWQVVEASFYLEFVQTGNRQVMEDVYKANTSALRDLVLGELVEGKGRFLGQIVNGIWTLCEMTSWSASAHLYMQKRGAGLPDVNDPIIDLGVGTTSALLAWTHFLLSAQFDKINPLISERIRVEIYKRVLQPFYTRNDFWWMGLERQGMVNNWNIWVNYNVLTCILLIENDFEKKVLAVHKTMRSADKFLNYYKDDGGCEEGPSYWGHAGGMLYKYLQLLAQATNGFVDKFNDPLVKNIGTYFCKAYITDGWYINYADASPKLKPDPGLVYSFGKAIKDSLMQGFGAYLAERSNMKVDLAGETLEALLRNVFLSAEILTAPTAIPAVKDFWLPGTQIAGAREKEGSQQGFYFSAIGGHNGESHNHNDVGTCILFYNGKPVLVDVGSGIYTRQTFGPERYSIWTMQSAYHNVPLINSIQQKDGKDFAASKVNFQSKEHSASFSLDIAAAYPDSAFVKKWIRKYELNNGKSFSITDSYTLSKIHGTTALHFMTNNEVSKVKEGLLKFTSNGQSVYLKYNHGVLSTAIERMEVTDPRLKQNWSVLNRIVFVFNDKKLSGENILTFLPE